MSLYQTILSDLMASMKAKDTERLNALRMAKASLLLALKEKGPSVTDLADDEVLAVLQREVKKRRDSASAFRDAGRVDLVEKEEAEIKIISAYLPAQLSDEDIERAVAEVVAAHPGEPFGVVMTASMQVLRGKADGNRVRSIVQRLTSSS